MSITLQGSTLGTEPVGPLLSGSDTLYEVINGERKEIPNMGVLASFLTSALGQLTGAFVLREKLGFLVVETLFRLAPDRPQRRPDVAFVSYQRWTEPAVPETPAWAVVPNLAMEVVSPNDLAEEIEQKTVEYLQSGVELVWVVYPHSRRIYVFDSLMHVSVKNDQDELDGGLVLPGFRLKLADLFNMAKKPASIS